MGVVTKRNNNSKQLNTNKSIVAFLKLNRSLKTSVRRYTQIPVSIPVAPVKNIFLCTVTKKQQISGTKGAKSLKPDGLRQLITFSELTANA